MKTGYWESANGNKSNSRKDASIVIYAALLMAFMVLVASMFDESASLIAAATSSGVLFITIGGPAMAFLFQQKRLENKQNGSGK